jgi:peptide/nickel transport system ATP-binding protein/oligopeptide transport system ATP-binding protein
MKPDREPAVLSVRDLRTWFQVDGQVARAVDGVSFDVRPGETLGLVGESGCGKTVTALSVLGLLPPNGRLEQGSSIVFQGSEELTQVTSRRMRDIRGGEISMIFQEPTTSLNPVQTIGDQVAEALRVHRDLSGREARAEAIRLLIEVGIPDPERRVDEHPHRLSGGMRQRVMIAMALSCDPRLLIADEPTTALDVTIQAQILELLARLRGRHGMAVLLITHDLGIVAEVCDRVVVMYSGQVVETGDVFDIFRRPAHPYTRGLLASLPTVDDPGRRLVPIPGTVPSPLALPVGCRFRERCPLSASKCVAEQAMVRLDDDRSVRCWRAGQIPSSAELVAGESR